MSCSNPMDRGPQEPACPAEEDAQTQRAVLALLLAEHPTQLTCSEFVRELSADPDAFAARDDVERAVRDLCGCRAAPPPRRPSDAYAGRSAL